MEENEFKILKNGLKKLEKNELNIIIQAILGKLIELNNNDYDFVRKIVITHDLYEKEFKNFGDNK